MITLSLSVHCMVSVRDAVDFLVKVMCVSSGLLECIETSGSRVMTVYCVPATLRINGSTTVDSERDY